MLSLINTFCKEMHLMLCVSHNAMRGHKILMSFKLASFPQQNSDIWAMEQGPVQKKSTLVPNTQEKWSLSFPVQK